MVQKLKRLPATAYSAKEVSASSELATKYYNILSKHGDGTMAQLLTAFFETTLDDELLREWRKYAHNPVSLPHIQELVKFLDEQTQIVGARSVEVSLPTPRSFNTRHFTSKSEKSKSVSLFSESVSLCKLCGSSNHPLYYCSKFKEMDVPARKQHLSKYPHCMNCLDAGHSLKQCRSKKSCRDCGQCHHSMLHVEVTPQVPQPTDTAAASSTGTQQFMVATQVSLGNQLPEKTSLVWMCQVLLEKGGRNQLVRGIIDSGSTMSFVTVQSF